MTQSTDQMASGGISISSIRRSDEDSKVSLKLVAMLAVVGIAIFVAGKLVWSHNGDSTVAAAAPVATELPYHTVVVTATVAAPTATATEMPAVFPTQAPQVIEVTRVVEQVRYETIYQEIPVEVTRIVEVPVLVPTATPTIAPSLAAGTVSICVDASAVKELYVGGVGIVGGGCRSFQVGEGSTFLEVQVNR